MKVKSVLIPLLLAALPAYAAPALSPIKLTDGVIVERDLISKDGQYMLIAGTGTWKIVAWMLNRANNNSRNFFGTQKGRALSMKAYGEKGTDAPPELVFEGTLNLEENRIESVITTAGGKQQAITFEPYIPVKNRPNFQFKFFGTIDPQATYKRTVTQVRVLKNGETVQTLEGFEAGDYRATYADYNFDGYFDLLLDVGGQAVTDSRHQYWIYNPKTGKFEYDGELSQYPGYPGRYPHKNILRVGDTLLERRGVQWHTMPCCAAIN